MRLLLETHTPIRWLAGEPLVSPGGAGRVERDVDRLAAATLDGGVVQRPMPLPSSAPSAANRVAAASRL